jgi:hypothetical protein
MVVDCTSLTAKTRILTAEKARLHLPAAALHQTVDTAWISEVGWSALAAAAAAAAACWI